MRITAFSDDKRSLSAKEYLDMELRDLAAGNMMLLPIPTTRDKTHVTGSEIALLSVASELKRGDIAVGYGLPEEFTLACLVRGASAVDLALDEEYQREGAYLTAIGCIGYILSEYSVAPSELAVGVIGYGRIGKSLCELLSRLGAGITLYTSAPSKAVGLNAKLYSELCYVKDMKLDILINTAPARLIPDSALIPPYRAELIELASGENIPAGASVTRLMQLPVRAFPESAGRAVGRAVVRALISNIDDGANL